MADDKRLKIRQVLRPPAMQPELCSGVPNNAWEQEADRVAEHVMRMPEPVDQRSSETEEEVEFMQGQAHEDISSTPGVTAPDFEHLKGDGQPLASETRAYFEPRFGVDFGDVSIHADDRAAAVAQAIQAKAFTFGHRIVFDQEQYAPNSEMGKHLLAHELTHVLQQSHEKPIIQKKPSEISIDITSCPWTCEDCDRWEKEELKKDTTELMKKATIGKYKGCRDSAEKWESEKVYESLQKDQEFWRIFRRMWQYTVVNLENIKDPKVKVKYNEERKRELWDFYHSNAVNKAWYRAFLKAAE